MIKDILLHTKRALGFAILLSFLAINAIAAGKTWTLVRESQWQAGFSDIHFVSQQDGGSSGQMQQFCALAMPERRGNNLANPFRSG